MHPLRITGLFTLRRPLGGSGSVLARSIASLIPTPKLRHILPALVLLRKPLSGLAKRRKQPERYVPFPLNFFAEFFKNLLTKILK
jgi:hypothetical protein